MQNYSTLEFERGTHFMEAGFLKFPDSSFWKDSDVWTISLQETDLSPIFPSKNAKMKLHF